MLEFAPKEPWEARAKRRRPAGSAGCRARALHVGHVSRPGPASLITSPIRARNPTTGSFRVVTSPTHSVQENRPNSTSFTPKTLPEPFRNQHLQRTAFTAEVQQSSRTKRWDPQGSCSFELPSCHRGPIADTGLEPEPWPSALRRCRHAA